MPRKPVLFDAASHERHHWWRAVLFRVAVCSVVSGLAWWATGWVGLLISVWLWAQALAGDLRDLFATLFGALRGVALRPMEGRFYQFSGQRMRVEDDDIERQRWISLKDLAKALGEPMPVAVLLRRNPASLRELADGLYLLDEAALDWLGQQRSDRAGRLRLWVEREVWYPARGRKASYRRKEEGAPTGAPAED